MTARSSSSRRAWTASASGSVVSAAASSLPGRKPSAGELAGVPGERPSPDLEGAVVESGDVVEDSGVAVVEEHRQRRSGGQAVREGLGEPGGLVLDVHLDMHRDRGLEQRVRFERGDVAYPEVDEVAQSGLGAQVAGGVDVGRGDVDADDAVAGAAGDLPRGSTESRADVQDAVALGEREATDKQVDRVGAADVELVEVVQRTVGRGVQVWMFAQELVDRLADSRFSVGHRTRSFPSLVVGISSARWCSGPGICGGWAGRKAPASSAPATATAPATTHPTLRPWSKALAAAWWTASAAAPWP